MASDNQPILKLLYVGQDEELSTSLARDDNFDLHHEESGYAAINFLSNAEVPDAILSELVLPGMSGYALQKEVLQQDRFQTVPFILVDAGFDREERIRALHEGVDDFYIKPLDPKKLHTRIRFLIRYKKSKSLLSIVASKQKPFHIPLIKRLFDIVFSSVALLLLSPLFLLVALAIKLESKGPVFYAAKRVGAGYRVFPFFKFRSMYTGADARLKELKHLNQYTEEEPAEDILSAECPECKRLGRPCSTLLYINDRQVCERQYLKYKRSKLGKTFNKIKNDPRVTRVGRFIRKTSIDELPQLFNVLRGEMSIVGNRPVPLYEAELLTSDDWMERFLAPAGITGLWQVSKRGKSDMSNDERKALDNEYARGYSFLKDIGIILRTFTAFMQKEDV